MEKVIGYAVALAMTLAAAGQLPGATMWLAKQMPQGPKLVSLSDFNRRLWEPSSNSFPKKTTVHALPRKDIAPKRNSMKALQEKPLIALGAAKALVPPTRVSQSD